MWITLIASIRDRSRSQYQKILQPSHYNLFAFPSSPRYKYKDQDQSQKRLA